MKYFRFLPVYAILFLTALLGACGQRADANVQTMQTTDCGVNWTLIKPGQRAPTTAGNICAYNSTLPAYAMQGDTEFKAQFQQNVLVTVRISYDYEIIDPVKFIGEAKFLGKQSSDGSTSESRKDNTGIEMAENSVIDKRIREATTSMTVQQNIVDFNTAKFEEELEKQTNKDLLERGVRINSMAFVMIPEDQTRMAIDAATAWNVYNSKGLGEFGKQMAIARAGATQIRIDTDKSK
mgnify:CR=1 FL=1